MKELRERDHDGAPLLFNAAASRGRRSCYDTARDLLYKALGYGGLMEQVEAIDRENRVLLMYAARSNHITTFETVFDTCKDGKNILCKHDDKGMGCLHHAAEAGCAEVLRKVIEKVGPDLLYQEATKRNNKGCTPIMLVLRNEGMEGYGCKNSDLKEKFHELRQIVSSAVGPSAITRRGGEGKTADLEWRGAKKADDVASLATASSSGQGGLGEDEKISELELRHAARGGLASLELALNNLDPSKYKANDDLNISVDLHEALGAEGDFGEAASFLLEAAAKRGDFEVLYHVLLAIQVSTCHSRDETGSSTDRHVSTCAGVGFLLEGLYMHAKADSKYHAVRFQLTKILPPTYSFYLSPQKKEFSLKRDRNAKAFTLSPQVDTCLLPELPHGGQVKDVVEAINRRHRSVFSYAVLSGNPITLRPIYNLVVKIFADNPDVVRLMTTILTFALGNRNSRSYALLPS